MRCLRLASASFLLGCNTVESGPGPSEDGMYSDEVGEEVDGVLVQCGNMLEANYYWTMQPDGPDQVHVMPVICVGSVDTPGFELESAQLIDGRYQSPSGKLISERSVLPAAWMLMTPTPTRPQCVEESFNPNAAWGDWAPADAPNCDSTVLPNVQSEPGIDMKIEGGHA